MRTVRLEASTSQFENLHAVLDKRRAGTKKVSVDADALAMVLRDHANLIVALRDDPSTNVEEP